MGLKIVIPIEYQRVKEISLTAMGFRGFIVKRNLEDIFSLSHNRYR